MSAIFHRLTPAHQHCFFGYYDLPAWDSSGTRHLAHRVQFRNRMPEPGDVAEIGFVTAGSPTFTPIAQTTAWNFQQGAMLQWLGGEDNTDRLIFNTRTPEGFGCVLYNTQGEQIRQLPLPAANVDPLGRFALSINFSRMMDFRPGYGYAGLPDPFVAEPQPATDGIHRFSLDGGAPRLILSLQELGEICRPYFGQKKLLINHLNLNPSGTRFIALVRHFPEVANGPFSTLAITANADGSDPFILWDGGVASHYHWRDDAVVSMVIKDPEGRITLAEFRDQSDKYRLIDPAFFTDDGHQSYSPDHSQLLYDSYPIDAERYLYLYDLQSHSGHTLGKVASEALDNPVTLETRCDLHPRWHPDGRSLSFDSIHEGFRGIYTLNL